jgi:hypothetical protein
MLDTSLLSSVARQLMSGDQVEVEGHRSCPSRFQSLEPQGGNRRLQSHHHPARQLPVKLLQSVPSCPIDGRNSLPSPRPATPQLISAYANHIQYNAAWLRLLSRLALVALHFQVCRHWVRCRYLIRGTRRSGKRCHVPFPGPPQDGILPLFSLVRKKYLTLFLAQPKRVKYKDVLPRKGKAHRANSSATQGKNRLRSLRSGMHGFLPDTKGTTRQDGANLFPVS